MHVVHEDLGHLDDLHVVHEDQRDEHYHDDDDCHGHDRVYDDDQVLRQAAHLYDSLPDSGAMHDWHPYVDHSAMRAMHHHCQLQTPAPTHPG
jgi:hypothetical protein